MRCHQTHARGLLFHLAYSFQLENRSLNRPGAAFRSCPLNEFALSSDFVELRCKAVSHFIDLFRALWWRGDGDEVFGEALAVGVEEVVDAIEVGGADD